jgi:hypothetical protein
MRLSSLLTPSVFTLAIVESRLQLTDSQQKKAQFYFWFKVSLVTK